MSERPNAGDTLRGCLIMVAVLGAVPCFWIGSAFLSSTSSTYTREPAPGGRYEIVRETWSSFLDGYTRLWITTVGEQDSSEWFEIAPAVDGTWFVDWWSPTEVVLTDYGAFGSDRRPYENLQWRDVVIEKRPPPSNVYFPAPDEMHDVVVWTYTDSRGVRSHAWLTSTWQNEQHFHADIVPEGKWSIEAEWRAADDLILRINPQEGVAMPEVAELADGIRVTLER